MIRPLISLDKMFNLYTFSSFTNLFIVSFLKLNFFITVYQDQYTLYDAEYIYIFAATRSKARKNAI